MVAFVGRIGIVNGAINFARAIPYVFSEKKDVSFLIMGMVASWKG